MAIKAALEFVECCAAATDVHGLAGAADSFTASLGIEHWACFEHVDYDPKHSADDPRHLTANTPMALHNYRRDYTRHYREQGYVRHDFVPMMTRRSLDPFPWSEAAARAKSPLQKSVVADAASAGLVDGYSVPIRAARAPTASFTAAGRDRLDPSAYPALDLAGVYLYETLLRLWPAPRRRSAVSLSSRERECLAWAAEGKSSSVIGDLTGLSRDTVDVYIDRARRRYGVATRVQAVARAIVDGEIAPQA